MIAIISGNWESATSDAGGLTLEMYELEAVLAGVPDVGEIVRLGFDSDPTPVLVAAQNDDLALIVGHSFGARTALIMAERIRDNATRVHLILLDPVRWEPNNMWAQFFPVHAKLPLPKNVVSCRVFVRSDPLGPVHFHVVDANGDLIPEQTIPNTDHVTIIKATNDIVLDTAREIFNSGGTAEPVTI